VPGHLGRGGEQRITTRIVGRAVCRGGSVRLLPCARHAAFADLRALAAALRRSPGVVGRLAEGAPPAPISPERSRIVRRRQTVAQRLSARDMLENPLRAYLLFGGLEPSMDALAPESLRTLARAGSWSR